MKRVLSIALVLLLGVTAAVRGENASGLEMVDSVRPYVLHLKLNPDDLKALISKQVIARIVSTNNSKEMAAFAAVLADASPEGFISVYRSLAIFRRNPHIIEVGQFSSAPCLSDLDKLTVEPDDLNALLKCRAGDSDLKLSEAEIAKIRAAVGAARQLTPPVRAKLATEYKKILVARVSAYLADGATGLGVYSDKDNPVNGQEAFTALLRQQAKGADQCERLYDYLEKYPASAPPDCESFVYWARQKFGSLKPVINLVHVVIHRDGGRIFIASKQIYSSHYTEAGLSMAELIPFIDNQGQPRTVIAYTIRLQVDMLGGIFGSMKKRMAQPRMVSTLKESIGGLRTNMESLYSSAASKAATRPSL